MIDVSSGRLVDFVATLTDPGAIAPLAREHAMLQRAREAAYRHPWSQAVLRALELPQPSRKQRAWLAQTLGIELGDAFALQFAGEVWDEAGRHAQVQADDLISEASGPLLSEVPAGTRLDLGFGGGEDDYWYFDMGFIQGSSAPPLLKGALGGSCVGEGARSEFVLP